jgi:hypothetical protein
VQILQVYKRKAVEMGWYTTIEMVKRIAKHSTKKIRRLLLSVVPSAYGLRQC